MDLARGRLGNGVRVAFSTAGLAQARVEQLNVEL